MHHIIETEIVADEHQTEAKQRFRPGRYFQKITRRSAFLIANGRLFVMAAADTRPALQSVSAALDFSSIFSKFHNSEDIVLKEDDFKYVLSYLFLHTATLRQYMNQIAKNPLLSYRLLYMRELFESPLPGSSVLQQLSFEDCDNGSQRLAFLKNDLDLMTADSPPLVFRLRQYEQFLVDSVPVLYARYGRDYPLSTFMSLSFIVGPACVISLCLSFPHFICPCFARALTGPDTRLLCYLCAMSPAHRPLLHPRLLPYPVHFALLAIRFFPDEAPLIITSALEVGLPGIRDELYAIRRRPALSHRFWLCYARCCAADASLSERDAELLDSCPDDNLLVHLLFAIENAPAKIFTDFIQRFQKTAGTMTTVLELFCMADANRLAEVSAQIRGLLGERFEWEARSAFSNSFVKSFDAFSFQESWFGTGTMALSLIGSLSEKLLSVRVLVRLLPTILNNTKAIEISSVDAIQKVIALLARIYLPGSPQEYQANVENIVSQKKRTFVHSKIFANSCRAVVWLVLILYSEQTRQNQHLDFGSLPELNSIPIRFILNCAYHDEKCNSVFPYLSKLCQIVVPYTFCQAPLMTHKPQFLLKCEASAPTFLQDLHPASLDDAAFNIWMIHRFIMPFNYSMETISALGGPREIGQLHEIFQFPHDILRNRIALKMIMVCLIDMISFWERLFGTPESKNDPLPSNYLILRKAIDLLNDPFVDPRPVCEFINDVFWTLKTPLKLLEALLLNGFDWNLIPKVVEGVPVLSDPLIHPSIKKNLGVSAHVSLFLFLFVSHLAFVHRTKAHYDLAKAVLGSFGEMTEKVIVVDSETLPVILDGLVRIAKAFPDMALMVDERIEGIRRSLPSACQMPLIDVALHAIVSHVMAGGLTEEDDVADEEEHAE
jgi:hypothetical protein